MKVHRFSDPAKFLERTRSFLEEREAENNLLLGIAAWLATHPNRIGMAPYFVAMEEDQGVQAAAMLTPPYQLVLSRANSEVLAAIVEHLLLEGVVPPGVNGPSQTSRTFAELWAQKTGRKFQLHRSLRIYELTRVISPAHVNGEIRLASKNDASTLVRWIGGFMVDIGGTESQGEASETFNRMAGDQRLYVWEDGELRSMAAWSAPTAHGVRISLVYTPPEFRGKGYASAVVAELSKAMLHSGRTFCCLFTDLSNQTSNRIYQSIGYSPVCNFTEYSLER